MCIKAVEEEPYTLECVSDQYITQEICNKALRRKPYVLDYDSGDLKTQELCDYTVQGDPSPLVCFADWLVTQQQLKIWDDCDDYCNDNGVIEWCEGYEKRKAQKAKIKKVLMRIAWHPSRWWDWYVPEDEKKETEKLWKQ